ncbi:hypothetical protein E1809_09840 [Arthrobacter terricola]|uniref:Uncharacterized protein n=1 Tax=Arthrobacter terricola TaxID=2547396 RepID=A0A4R5KLD9_9MICC|nr:hypothetical protein E1809_09840 [Arthrobacter terricola]
MAGRRGIVPRPDGGLTGYRRAVALALGKERDGQVETTRANAGADADPLPSDPECLILPAMSRNIARAAADLQASDAASP